MGSTTYNSNTVTTGTATLYEKSGYHAIVKITGKIDQFQYTVFIYAYAGKPYIKVVSRYYYDNEDGGESSIKSIRDIALIVKTNIVGGDVRFSTLINNIQGDTGAAISSAQTDTAILNYSDPDNYTIKSGTTTTCIRYRHEWNRKQWTNKYGLGTNQQQQYGCCWCYKIYVANDAKKYLHNR